MFVCPDGAVPFTRKSTAGPPGIAWMKWISGLVSPSVLPASEPPHALRTEATPITAAMVRISFIVFTFNDVRAHRPLNCERHTVPRPARKPCSLIIGTVSRLHTHAWRPLPSLLHIEP